MSSTTKTTAKTRKRTGASTGEKAQARPQRKATFKVEKVKNQLVFTAVNKRAHKLARLMGKRTKLTSADLKTALSKRPNMHPFVYTKTNTLAPVTFKG